jgi:stage II sporulation protein D
MKGRHWWLSVLLWVALVAPAQAALQLRVAIEQGVSQVKVGSSTKAVVRDYSTGRKLGQIAAMNAVYALPSSRGVTVNQMQSGTMGIEPTGNGYVYIGDRWYRGKTLVFPTDKGLTAVNYVDLEQYLYSVLGSEMNGNWPQEALKAQAVAARTYAIYKRENESNGFYDLGDTQASQVYNGIVSETSSTHKAVNATAGQVLTYKNQIILSVFHACSGGHTENVENVWSQSLPYLRGVQDFDRDVRECQWVKTLSGQEISKRISGVGNVMSLTPSFTPYGSIKAIKFVGDRGTRELKGEALRNALGLRSMRFTITEDPLGLRLYGRGWGHGLGMSQWGAYYLAKLGINYQQILAHYYRGTGLARIQVQ